MARSSLSNTINYKNCIANFYLVITWCFLVHEVNYLKKMGIVNKNINPLSANHTVFDHFVRLALKGYKNQIGKNSRKCGQYTCTDVSVSSHQV